jgi:hypothetical protein
LKADGEMQSSAGRKRLDASVKRIESSGGRPRNSRKRPRSRKKLHESNRKMPKNSRRRTKRDGSNLHREAFLAVASVRSLKVSLTEASLPKAKVENQNPLLVMQKLTADRTRFDFDFTAGKRRFKTEYWARLTVKNCQLILPRLLPRLLVILLLLMQST